MQTAHPLTVAANNPLGELWKHVSLRPNAEKLGVVGRFLSVVDQFLQNRANLVEQERAFVRLFVSNVKPLVQQNK